MPEILTFGGKAYCVFWIVVAFSRAMDFLSTWVATPNLVLEGNPIAKKLGWRWGVTLNIAICFAVAFQPLLAISISTTSILVAARNFQSAWLMRLMGEEHYRDWHVARLRETPVTTYLLCLTGNTALYALTGLALIYFCAQWVIPCAIGMGIVAYAIAVVFYSLLAFWRIRRSRIRRRFAPENPGVPLDSDLISPEENGR